MASSSPWVRPLVWIAAVVAMCLPLLASSEDPTNGDLRDEISRLIELQQDAWNRGDLTGFMSGYDQSDQIVFASGGEITRGWQVVLDRYRARYDSPEKMGQLRFTIHQVDLLGDDHAKVLGGWELTREEDRPHGLFTLVLQRGPDGWRVIHDHTSAATP